MYLIEALCPGLRAIASFSRQYDKDIMIKIIYIYVTSLCSSDQPLLMPNMGCGGKHEVKRKLRASYCFPESKK